MRMILRLSHRCHKGAYCSSVRVHTLTTWRNVLLIVRSNVDEKLSIYVVLRTPYQDEGQLKGYISRLQIVLEAHATSSSPRAGDSHQGQTINQPRDVIWSGKVNVSEDPIIVVEESDDGDEGQAVLVIWRLSAFLSRVPLYLVQYDCP